MKTQSAASDKRTYELNLHYFQIKRTAKICLALIYTIQLITRLVYFFLDPSLKYRSRRILVTSLPFCLLLILPVIIEHLFFKKKGPGIVKYSKIIDFIILLVFTSDWILNGISSLYRVSPNEPHTVKVSALLVLISFSWRTLLVTLIVEKWQLKIIAPVAATTIVTVYTVYYEPENAIFLVFRGIAQLFNSFPWVNIILIIYCEDKIRWKLMWTNIQQEKWMQVNNFILNNIPEKIIILDLAGKTKFISDHCKSFMKKYHFGSDTKDFLRRIRDLQPQFEPETPHLNSSESVLNIERLTTCNGLLGENNNNKSAGFVKVDVLEEFIINFPTLIKQRNLQERQFLVYNGKLKMTENHLPDKSIEVKISFVQHFENNYIVLIFRDTTQRDLLVTLKETNKYKDQLLASVSHELRAPLNGNINLVESAVNSPKIPDSVKENLLTPALRSSKFLLHIINDILDLSQIKEKKLRLVFQSGDLKETLKSAAQLVELQAQRKGIELRLELDSKLPKNFCTDHIRLSQIVLNLLTNAIKFTKEGAVKLIAELIPGAPSWIKITVEDSGIGISKENMQKLFSQSSNLDSEERQTLNPTGAGLGLNIASNLAELLAPSAQPSIHVTSTLNQGSVFSFIIENKIKSPIELEDAQCQEFSCEVAEELAEGTNLQDLMSPRSVCRDVRKLKTVCPCPKILIVDDNPFNTMALETVLNSLEIECSSVYSGSDALEKLLNHKANACGSKNCKAYSVVFMDQEMPEMSGIETVAEIKRLQREKLVSQAMKIIGCTAHKAKEEVDRFMASGLDHCLFKPVSIAMIRDTLKEFLL